MLFATLLLIAPQAEPAVAPAEVLLAVTRGGARVEVAEAPERGALEVQTPWGVYSTPTDPVEIVLRTTAKRDWMRPEEAAPGRASLERIEELAADGRIGELLELAAWAEQRWTGRDDFWRVVALHRALEDWGARLRVVPSEVAYADRSEWLWERIGEVEGPRASLLTGALLAELPRYSDTSTLRRLPPSALSSGIDDRRARVRRAAGLAAARQGDGDRTMLLRLLERSMSEADAGAREAFAAAAFASWAEVAGSYWYRVLARGPSSARHLAAQNITLHDDGFSLDYLAFALSAHDQRVGRRFRLGPKSVQVTRDGRQLDSLLQEAAPRGFFDGDVIVPDASSFAVDGVITVRRLDEELVATLTTSLALLTGGGDDWTPLQWMDWYRELVGERL
jgi:hypothetical protein